SIWMRQLQQTFATGHAQSGENPELRTLFYRLAMLAEHPIHLIFVADSPLRPRIKRGKQVKTTLHWLAEGMRHFVNAFGFGWLDAAGEAKAELAKMNELRVIDAVMSEDSDVLLFGARVVLRNPSFKRSTSGSVEVYRNIVIFQNAGLSQGDLILYALLVGSDYDSIGLRGCGARTARGVLKYELGNKLIAGFLAYTGDERTRWIARWRSRLQEVLRTDPRGFIGRTHPSLASSITPAFPDLHILRLFLEPQLLNITAYEGLSRPSVLDVARIGELCELYFTWGSRAGILKTLRSTLWPCEVARMLI
ncbi:PIN domain-like protein, partial [Trametes elegans]